MRCALCAVHKYFRKYFRSGLERPHGFDFQVLSALSLSPARQLLDTRRTSGAARTPSFWNGLERFSGRCHSSKGTMTSPLGFWTSRIGMSRRRISIMCNRFARAPLIFSHSSARAISSYPRNVPACERVTHNGDRRVKTAIVVACSSLTFACSPEPAVPSINSSCMRLANFLQPGCFGRLHVGRFKSRRRLYSGVEV